MFYLTQDQKLSNLNSYQEVQFMPSPEAAVRSRIVGSGSMGAVTTQVPIDVQYEQAAMVGIREKVVKKFLGSKSVTESSVLRDNMTAASLIADLRGMAQQGIDPVQSIHIEASNVYPLKSTPESWFTSRGLDKSREVEEGSPENILRKNPIFTVDVTVWVKPFDGESEPFPVRLRNAPITYVSALMVNSNAAQMLPGKITTNLTPEAFQEVVPAEDWTHYMKEEAMRINAKGPRKTAR